MFLADGSQLCVSKTPRGTTITIRTANAVFSVCPYAGESADHALHFDRLQKERALVAAAAAAAKRQQADADAPEAAEEPVRSAATSKRPSRAGTRSQSLREPQPPRHFVASFADGSSVHLSPAAGTGEAYAATIVQVRSVRCSRSARVCLCVCARTRPCVRVCADRRSRLDLPRRRDLRAGCTVSFVADMQRWRLHRCIRCQHATAASRSASSCGVAGRAHLYVAHTRRGREHGEAHRATRAAPIGGGSCVRSSSLSRTAPSYAFTPQPPAASSRHFGIVGTRATRPCARCFPTATARTCWRTARGSAPTTRACGWRARRTGASTGWRAWRSCKRRTPSRTASSRRARTWCACQRTDRERLRSAVQQALLPGYC